MPMKTEVLILEENKQKIGLKESSGFMYRHTCALLSASWSLSRLGIYTVPEKAVKNLTEKKFVARKLITILPEKYREVENKVIEIIKSTKFKDTLNNIEYKYFD